MGVRRCRFAALLLIGLVLVTAASKPLPPPPAPLPPLTLDAAHPIVDATIAGMAVRLRVDPSADSFIILAPEATARLQLGDPVRTIAGQPIRRGTLPTKVGRVEIENPYSWEEVVIAGRPAIIRIVMPANAHYAEADGSISPGWLPQPQVRLLRRPGTTNDVWTIVPSRRDAQDGIVSDIRLGKNEIMLQFAPDRAVTIATASAGSILAEAGDGLLTGPVEQVQIMYGVARPVRRIALAQPIIVAGRRLQQFQVRLFDWSGKRNLPIDNDPDADFNVTGERGRQRGLAMLHLGADVLEDCAEIDWDAATQSFALLCPTAP